MIGINELPLVPDAIANAGDVFGISNASELEIPAFSKVCEYVPQVDPDYIFDSATTLAILAGIKFNRKVLLQGFHGTGKSTHIEQVCARLNWPCIRINLDSHISRVDLLGRDAIVLEDGKQITKFREGIIPWSLQHPVALVLDEYDAGRPDVLFVIQRLLEAEGKLTLVEQNRVIHPHPSFRIFATANTIGLGDSTGLYHGTQALNQGQLDRWSIIASLNYLPMEREVEIVCAKVKSLPPTLARQMVAMADLTRMGFMSGDISVVMSPRTVIHWAQNHEIFPDLADSFRLTFLNRVDETEKVIVAEYYQRCFNSDIIL